jgi:outer membrane protein TolC
MRKSLLLFIVFILACPAVIKAEEVPLTLSEAVLIALRDNREILLKAEELKKAKSKISESESELFPTLDFTASWLYNLGYYTKDFAQTATQVTLKKYLYKGGKIMNTIKYNGYNFEVSQAILDKTKLETILDLKKAFYTLLLAKELSVLNKDILLNSQEHLNLVRARYKNGQASESDILNIEASLQKVEQAYRDSLNQVEAAQVLLNNLLYLDKDSRIVPIAEFNYAPQEVAYDEGFLRAMSNRPEIRQYETQIKAAQKAIEINKAGSRPEIYASWDYYSRSHTSGTATKNWDDYNTAGLTVSWPLFDSWSTKAKVEQAIVDLKQVQLLKEKTTRDIILELKNAYLSLKDAIAKIKTSESELKVYNDYLLSTEDKYAQGISSSLELSDAKVKFAVSGFNQKQAIYDYIIAKESFAKATGGSL